MNPKPYLLGIDQGTSGSRAVVMDRAGQIVGYAYRPVARIYPHNQQRGQGVTDWRATIRAANNAALFGGHAKMRSVGRRGRQIDDGVNLGAMDLPGDGVRRMSEQSPDGPVLGAEGGNEATKALLAGFLSDEP